MGATADAFVLRGNNGGFLPGAPMTYFRWFIAAASAAFLVLTIHPLQAQDKAKGEKSAKKAQGISKSDMQAMQKLAQADMAEIEAGKVAMQKASSSEVKKFGEHMVQEHSKMLDEGKKLAQSKGVKPPAATDKKHQEALKKLEALSGEDFDRRYMQQMVKDHEDVLKLAQKTAKDAKDPDLKSHVEKGTPHIKEHLDQARKIQASFKKAKQ
jgi:putative membrane protein